MHLREFLSSTWDHIQDNLFPWLREELGPLTDLHRRVIVTLELARVETLVGVWRGLPGRLSSAVSRNDFSASGRLPPCHQPVADLGRRQPIA